MSVSALLKKYQDLHFRISISVSPPEHLYGVEQGAELGALDLLPPHRHLRQGDGQHLRYLQVGQVESGGSRWFQVVPGDIRWCQVLVR